MICLRPPGKFHGRSEIQARDYPDFQCNHLVNMIHQFSTQRLFSFFFLLERCLESWGKKSRCLSKGTKGGNCLLIPYLERRHLLDKVCQKVLKGELYIYP